MRITPQCSRNGSSALLFCFSGAADTAEIGDRVVRMRRHAKNAKMFCLAGIAGGFRMTDLGWEKGEDSGD